MDGHFARPRAGAPDGGLDGGLSALMGFVRRATGADAAVAFEAGADGLAVPLITDPELPIPSFSLAGSHLERRAWKTPLPADDLQLPTAVLIAFEQPVGQAMLIPTPVPDAPRSGLLLLWFSNQPASCDCPFRAGIGEGLAELAPAFAQMLRDRRTSLYRQIANDRFHDLFGSVPNPIVLLEGGGLSGLANERAAELLGLTAGELAATEIAAAMRSLRDRCGNAEALRQAYSPLLRDINAAVKVVWDLGDRQFEVDTHPVQGDGRNGRIWLFEDVTAQLRYEESLRSMAATDSLTGLYNRRHFLKAGREIIEEVGGDGRAAGALMIDIDHFKSINDTHGHAVGDLVLQTVGSRISQALRAEDLVARMGGEEFAVLLAGLPVDRLARTAERVRTAIAEFPVVTHGAAIPVTISIGVAQSRGTGEPLERLLARADRALYDAKRGGRNRVAADLGAELQASPEIAARSGSLPGGR